MKILLTIRDGNEQLRKPPRFVIETGDNGVDICREWHPRMCADRSCPVEVFDDNGEALTLVLCVELADG